MDPVPDLVTMHLWTVPDRRVPIALLRMAGDRGLLGRTVGLRFAKLLGTGDGRTFTVRDADRNRWGLLATWDKAVDITAFEAGPVARGWGRIADERLRVDLRPLTSRGRWSGREPFGTPEPDRAYDGPVAAVPIRPACGSRWASARHRSGCRAPSACGTPPPR